MIPENKAAPEYPPHVLGLYPLPPEMVYDLDLEQLDVQRYLPPDWLPLVERAEPSVKTSTYSSLKWNVKAQKYFLPKGSKVAGIKPGTFLSPKAVRTAIEQDIADKGEKMLADFASVEEAAQAYVDGRITRRQWGRAVSAWRDSAAGDIKHLGLNHVAAGRGGFAHMTQGSYGRAGAWIKYNYGKLNNFAQEIYEDPGIVLGTTPGKMPAQQRLKLYAKNALFAYEAERVIAHKEQGFTRRRNVQHSEKPCKGCIKMTERGFRAIDDPEWIAIGRRDCGPLDLCTWEFDKGEVTDGDGGEKPAEVAGG